MILLLYSFYKQDVNINMTSNHCIPKLLTCSPTDAADAITNAYSRNCKGGTQQLGTVERKRRRPQEQSSYTRTPLNLRKVILYN